MGCRQDSHGSPKVLNVLELRFLVCVPLNVLEFNCVLLNLVTDLNPDYNISCALGDELVFDKFLSVTFVELFSQYHILLSR